MTLRELGRNWRPPSRNIKPDSNALPPLAIEYVSIDLIKPDSENPRRHSDNQVKRLTKLVAGFGVIAPLLVGEDGVIIAGELRWLAAQRLGLAAIPVVRVTHLDLSQRRALMLADNQLATLASWDEAKLGKLLQGLSVSGLDFDLELTGFDVGEIDMLIENLDLNVQEANADDTVPEPSHVAISKLGDLWFLGQHHRLLCSNALDATAYGRLMAGKKAHIVVTDPPYNVRIRGHVSGLGQHKHREFAMASGEMTAIEFTTFLTCVTGLMAQNSIDGSIHFVFMDWRHIFELLQAGRASYTELKNLCVWSKNNAGMGSLYRSQHELVGVFKNGRAPHRNNIQLGRFGRHRTNIWNYPGASTLAHTSDERNPLEMHPTSKSVAMIADAILDCSARGDIVLDPFAGSGSGLISAERTGRRFFGMEIDPLYTDVIIRRYRDYSGQDAVHAETGRTFTAMEGELDDQAK